MLGHVSQSRIGFAFATMHGKSGGHGAVGHDIV